MTHLQHDVLRKPQGSVKLDDQTRISHVRGELTFEVSIYIYINTQHFYMLHQYVLKH